MREGRALGGQGKLPEAIQVLTKAIDVYTRVKKEEGQEFEHEFARSLSMRAHALGASGKLPEAMQDCNKAIGIYTRQVEKEGRTELADELARRCGVGSQHHSGEGSALIEPPLPLPTRSAPHTRAQRTQGLGISFSCGFAIGCHRVPCGATAISHNRPGCQAAGQTPYWY